VGEGRNRDIPPLNIDCNLCNNYQTTAGAFNVYFTTVADKMLTNDLMTINELPNTTHPVNYLYQAFKRPFSNIKLTPASTKQTREIVKSLKLKYSDGYDEVPVKILKIHMPFTIFPLTYISNQSLSTGTYPT
jgi:hypothetical protein